MQGFQRIQRRDAMAVRGVLAGLMIVAAGCSRQPPEAALRETIVEAQDAIKSRDAGALQDVFAEDFIGNDAIDRDDARRLAALYFLDNSDVGITLGPLDVTISGAQAEVSTTAALTGGSGRLLPDSAGVYAVRSGWRLEGNDWRMTSLEWTRP